MVVLTVRLAQRSDICLRNSLFKNPRVAGLLNDIACEELSHLEIVGTIVHQLVKDLPCDEVDTAGFEKYYVDHTLGVWPQSAGGVPFTATEFQSSGDPIADLVEDMAADGTTT